MRKPNYNIATNAAYRVLSEVENYSLSTDVFAIANSLAGCKLLTYSQVKFLYGFTDEMLFSESDYGFTFLERHTDRRIILYNENLPLACVRFTIAHEIGHKVLCHSEEEEAWEEKEANCFARNLLCPIPVAYGLGLTCPDDYVSVFNVSATAAKIAFNSKALDCHHISEANFQIMTDILDAHMMGFGSVGELYSYLVS